jgi:hypothetical protein
LFLTLFGFLARALVFFFIIADPIALLVLMSLELIGAIKLDAALFTFKKFEV